MEEQLTPDFIQHPTGVVVSTVQREGESKRIPRGCHPLNRPFVEYFTKRRFEAVRNAEKQQAITCKRVCRSLMRYPLPVQSAPQALKLDGVGKSFASIFERILSKDAKEFTLISKNEAHGIEEYRRRKLHQTEKFVSTFIKDNHRTAFNSVAGASVAFGCKEDKEGDPVSTYGVDVDLAVTPKKVKVGRPLSKDPKKIEGRTSGDPSYRPKAHSQAWQALMCLYFFSYKNENKTMSKFDISAASENLSALLDSKPIVSLRFMGALELKGLVQRVDLQLGSKTKLEGYKLTKHGVVACEELTSSLDVPMDQIGTMYHTDEFTQNSACGRINDPENAQAENELVKCELKESKILDAEVDSNENGTEMAGWSSRYKDLSMQDETTVIKGHYRCGGAVGEFRESDTSLEPNTTNYSDENCWEDYWSKDDYCIVLLLDTREICGNSKKGQKEFVVKELIKNGVNVETRQLALGDVVWIARCNHKKEANSSRPLEFVLPWILERKSLEDLSQSILDGRYEEQKYRLLRSPGISQIFYLIEGLDLNPNERRKRDSGLLSHKALLNAQLHTQQISGFTILLAPTPKHTASIISALHHRIINVVGTSARNIAKFTKIPQDLQYDFQTDPFMSCMLQRPSWSIWQAASQKTSMSTAYEIFGKQLRMVPHCGPECVEALISLWPTPLKLYTALLETSCNKYLLAYIKTKLMEAKIASITILNDGVQTAELEQRGDPTAALLPGRKSKKNNSRCKRSGNSSKVLSFKNPVTSQVLDYLRALYASNTLSKENVKK